MAENEAPKTEEAASEADQRAREEASSFLQVRDSVPAGIRDVSFPLAIRGYDRAAVEAYVERVNRVIAELEVSRSPQAAIRHALDRVGEQTVSILREARESAEKIAAAAREDADKAIEAAKAQAADLVVNASAEAEQQKADGRQALADAQAHAAEIVAQARAEAEGIVADARGEAERRQQQTEDEIEAVQTKAEARLRDLEAEAHAVAAERDSLLEELRTIGRRLHEVANTAATREADTTEAAPQAEASARADADAGDTMVVEPRN